MKILMINVDCGIGSAGRICTDLTMTLEAQGHELGSRSDKKGNFIYYIFHRISEKIINRRTRYW